MGNALTKRSLSGHGRKRDADKTKHRILQAALGEFSHHGFAGARIDRIAKNARCNIRMLYHYFGNKKGIYVAVLENAYDDIRRKEATLALDQEEPLPGLLKLLHFTYDYFSQNPLFEGLLRNENLMQGKFVLRSRRVTQTAFPLRNAIARLIRRGIARGVFRADLDHVQVYVTIAALSRFHLANAYSLSALLNSDLTSIEWRRRHFDHACSVLEAYLTSNVRLNSVRHPLRSGGAKSGSSMIASKAG
jgi:AcrR family transcriptional regulator